ncbi:MAG: GlsB/YeaQ/YmgE family stress response membrane protein [Candidatus Eisenbacteria bacterium]
MGWLSWIVFGAFAGWIASLITGRQHGCCLSIIVGIIGAFIGGFILEAATGRVFNPHFNLRSFAVAVVGSVILLVVAGLISRTR